MPLTRTSTVNDVAQLIMKCTVGAGGSNTKDFYTTFYYRNVSPGVDATKASLKASFMTQFYAAFLAAVNSSWASAELRVRFMNNRTDPTLAIAMAGTGAITTDALPKHNTVVVNLGGAIRGQQYRSRRFFAPANEVDTTLDVLVAGLTRWQAVRDACLLPLTDQLSRSWVPTMLIMGKKTAPVSNLKVQPCIITTEDITTAVLDIQVSSMKKRRVRVVH